MKARTLLILFAVACLAIAAVVWLGPVYSDNRATRDSIASLQETLNRQAQDIERLNRELRELRTDYRAIERVARERFGMCKPGEQIYHFEPAPGAGEGAPASPSESPKAGAEPPAAP